MNKEGPAVRKIRELFKRKSFYAKRKRLSGGLSSIADKSFVGLVAEFENKCFFIARSKC